MTKFRKLSRPTGHRMSMLRTMVSQLVKHERIETTVAKAKEIRRLADNMVQLGKEGSLCAARRAAAFVREIEKVDIQDCYGLVYELVMLPQWHILSLLTEIMNLGKQSPPILNHLRKRPSIPGQDLGSASSLHHQRRIYRCLRYEVSWCKAACYNREILFHTSVAWSHGFI
ncbi:hypothetical protein I3842_03G124500 [Carya illinoinensis]|uniref:Ribosomal protein L17 n=1 Tax=Carya illinoinensis TaxID=32201 RepID=A0A922FJF9_CARIL|nr:hypothetical protein I3842_03G124500 [Carya illinoinensis]KAG6721690.1 hypothetical protein I3842_03G124500 [Carya illinoinensis]